MWHNDIKPTLERYPRPWYLETIFETGKLTAQLHDRKTMTCLYWNIKCLWAIVFWIQRLRIFLMFCVVHKDGRKGKGGEILMTKIRWTDTTRFIDTNLPANSKVPALCYTLKIIIFFFIFQIECPRWSSNLSIEIYKLREWAMFR